MYYRFCKLYDKLLRLHGGLHPCSGTARELGQQKTNSGYHNLCLNLAYICEKDHHVAAMTSAQLRPECAGRHSGAIEQASALPGRKSSFQGAKTVQYVINHSLVAEALHSNA